MRDLVFSYKGKSYPEYLKQGNGQQYIAPIAKKFCVGKGLDIGSSEWPLEGAIPYELKDGNRAEKLPPKQYDYLFSSHCLEHVENPIKTLEHWKTRLKEDGVLFLYLPHPDMEYWLPQNCRKHLHSWAPEQMAKILEDLGFANVLYSGRDLAWGYAVVGFNVDPRTDLKTTSPQKKWVEEMSEERIETIVKDPEMYSLMKEFGMGIFRRSSVFHGLDDILRESNITGDTCLEIGTFHGVTTIVLARYFKKVISIDILDSKYRQKIAEHLGIKNIEFHTVKNNEEKARLVDKLKFDFCFMDGDHEHDTESDFELVKRCKRVLFHEYWKDQPPVMRLVDSLSGKVVRRSPMAYWHG